MPENVNILEWSDLHCSNDEIKKRIKKMHYLKKAKSLSFREINTEIIPKKISFAGLHSFKIKRSKSEPFFGNNKHLMFEDFKEDLNENFKEDNAKMQHTFFSEVRNNF